MNEIDLEELGIRKSFKQILEYLLVLHFLLCINPQLLRLNLTFFKKAKAKFYVRKHIGHQEFVL